MPKIVDYAARFEFLREAAFRVVHRDGPEVLSRRRLATELGCSESNVRRLVSESASLPALAAQEAVSRSRHARMRQPRLRDDDPLARAVDLVTRHVPEDVAGAGVHLVWLKVSLARPSVTERTRPADEDGLPLPARVQIADQGWTDLDEGPSDPERTDDPAIEDVCTTRDADEEHDLKAALELVDASPSSLAELRALVHGLSLDVCLGHLEAKDVRTVVQGHLARVTT